jgi:hypothetical protein
MNYYDSPLRLLIYYKITNTFIRNGEISTSYNKEKVDIVDLIIQKFKYIYKSYLQILSQYRFSACNESEYQLICRSKNVEVRLLMILIIKTIIL